MPQDGSFSNLAVTAIARVGRLVATTAHAALLNATEVVTGAFTATTAIISNLRVLESLTVRLGGLVRFTLPIGALVSTNTSDLPTIISTVNTPVKCVVGQSDPVATYQLIVDGPNRIRYTGTNPAVFQVTITVDVVLEVSPGNNRLFNFYIARDDVIITNSKISANLRDNASNQPVSVSITIPIIWREEQYLEIWCENTETTDNCILQNLVITCLALATDVNAILPTTTTSSSSLFF